LAVKTANRDGTILTMVLTLRDGDGVNYFTLSHDRRDGKPPYSLRPWRATDSVDIGASNNAVPDMVFNAVTYGVPIPRHGSLFGWVYEEAITAIVPVYTTYTPENPEPSWTVMPCAAVSEKQWPSFTYEHFFGQWFWQYYQAGSIVSLGRLIAGTRATVFWIDIKAVLGSECCAVARDTRSPEGYTLPRGCYVHYEVLRSGKPLPSLGILLAESGKTDLAPRFRMLVESQGAISPDPVHPYCASDGAFGG
jgi:hypothetical protein